MGSSIILITQNKIILITYELISHETLKILRKIYDKIHKIYIKFLTNKLLKKT